MAVFHVKVGRILKSQTPGGATGFAKYLAREDQEQATQHARYLSRESHPAKDDLVLYQEANLPAWAQDGAHFFAMAEHYERQGGIVARTYEIALPRELSWQGRSDLAGDIAATYFGRHPHVMAVHCPKARDGQDQPHVHLMVCERLLDGIERSPKQFFSRAASGGRDPASGGARKDPVWKQRETIGLMREGIAILTNGALEREGLQVAVSHETLKARGIERPPEVELTNAERWALAHGRVSPKHRENLTQRATAHAEWKPWEQEQSWQRWQDYRERYGLGIDREEVLDHVRDRFWVQDRSPYRDAEREQSQWRAVGREVERWQHEREAPSRGRTLVTLARALDDDGPAGGAIQVRLRSGWNDHERQRDIDRSMG